ncbi:MAG TPA: pyrroline-5-carboxylate reductase dimerization domain-containing protein [Spirochaetia bacterium]|nr:pyrroline-5-carboxylate reductase dimerization domain-containing protein [Spirochaetia bacterium]
MKRIGIVGFGVIGEAFAVGLRKKMPDAVLAAFDVKHDLIEAAVKTLGVQPARDASEVFASDITILCVKPQDFAQLATEVRYAAKGRRVISVLAGRRVHAIAEALETENVARFMPNISALKGTSVVGISLHVGADEQTRKDSLAVAEAVGTPFEIPERLMSAMTGLSGSGLAYVLAFVHAMTLGGVAAGFDYRTALSIVVAGLESAASLLRDGTHPVELASRITSAGGTTIQGIRALEKGGFTASVIAAVEAAARKASEMES